MKPRPRSSCRHRLPISNGWGFGGDDERIAVWCRHCDASIDVTHDADWLDRYEASKGYRPTHLVARWVYEAEVDA